MQEIHYGRKIFWREKKKEKKRSNYGDLTGPYGGLKTITTIQFYFPKAGGPVDKTWDWYIC